MDTKGWKAGRCAPARARTSLAAVLAVVALAAGCGGGGGDEPSREPVPSALRGTWTTIVPGTPAVASVLALEPSLYRMQYGTDIDRTGSAHLEGDILVLGTSGSSSCAATGVGRYRWTLAAGELRFVAEGADLCSNRGAIMANAVWRR